MRIILLLLALTAPLAAQDSPIHVLQQQQAAWNHHDLEAFMSGYWNSPDLTFFSTKKTSGWQATFDKYRKTYQGEGHEMGTLEFSDLQVEELSSEGGVRSRQLEADPVGRQDTARTIHADIPQISRGMEDRARPLFGRWSNDLTSALAALRVRTSRGTLCLRPAERARAKTPTIFSPAPARGCLRATGRPAT